MALKVEIIKSVDLKYKKIMDLYTLIGLQLIDIYKDLINSIENDNFEILKEISEDFIKYSRDFTFKLLSFIEDGNNRSYLFLEVGGNTLLDRLDRLFLVFGRQEGNILNPRAKLIRSVNNLHSFFSWFKIFEDFVSKQKQSDELVNSLTFSVNEAKEQAKNLEAAIQAINGSESEVLYATASDKYLEHARTYEVLFYLLLGGSVLFTIVHLSFFPYTDLNKINFIFVKILMFTVVLTLGTLFLRKAAHLRKLHDQAYNTSLELKSLPLFLRNIEKSEHSEIYKELIPKYFGKEINQNQNDKMGDLLQDQVKSSIELVKASLEITKKNNSKPVN